MANILSVNIFPSGTYIGHQALCDLLGLTYDSGTLTAYKGTKVNACFKFSVATAPFNITTCYNTTINSSYNIYIASTVPYLHYLITTNGVIFGVNNNITLKHIQAFIDKTYDGTKYVYGSVGLSSSDAVLSVDGELGLSYTNSSFGIPPTRVQDTDFVNLSNIFFKINRTIIQNVFVASCFNTSTETVIFTLDGVEYVSSGMGATSPPLVVRLT